MGLILASGSPRRREMLETTGVELFAVEPSNVPEVRLAHEGPEEYCRRLARDKANASTRNGHWILSADTIVVDGHDIFEKPFDSADAFRMLSNLSNGWHQVISAWALRYVPNADESEVLILHHCVSKVRFRNLSDSEIYAYISTGEPFDKAGGYGIQGKGAALVQEIQGSYSNIVGMPLADVLSALREHNVIT